MKIGEKGEKKYILFLIISNAKVNLINTSLLTILKIKRKIALKFRRIF